MNKVCLSIKSTQMEAGQRHREKRRTLMRSSDTLDPAMPEAAFAFEY